MKHRPAHAARGATLLEIAVLIAIFLVMAVAVTPRFAGAGQSAMRDALRLQVDQINRSIEMFRADHDDAPPPLGGDGLSGWRPLVAEGYFVQPPVNALLKTAVVVRAETDPALLTPDATTSKARIGWFYSESRGRVVANGFDHFSGAFFDEPGYDPKAFAW
jgi:type II secretory pathway pseudopilin PulG